MSMAMEEQIKLLTQEVRNLRMALGAAYFMSRDFGSPWPLKLEAYQALSELVVPVPSPAEESPVSGVSVGESNVITGGRHD